MRLSVNGRTLALVLVLVPLVAVFVFVVLRSGPLAPVPVTVTTVEKQAVAPALFGMGTVESRYTYRLGPTVSGRLKQVNVHVGDLVLAGQLLGEMDPVDIEERIGAADATIKRAAAGALVAEAQVRDLRARKRYAEVQAGRYEQLALTGSVSDEVVETKQQERLLAETGQASAEANSAAVRQEHARARAERAALVQQRDNLRFVAPVDGIVVARNADPGSTVVSGQSVVEVIDPGHLWINVRFDQLGAVGLRAGLPAKILLRTHARAVSGKVLRIEPTADPVTEEILAKVVFDQRPDPLPPIGEIAEITVTLPALSPVTSVPNAAIKRIEGTPGVWTIKEQALSFSPVKLGAADLDGRVQIVEGLEPGERVVLYSMRALAPRSRIKIVESLPGISP